MELGFFYVMFVGSRFGGGIFFLEGWFVLFGLGV